MRRYDAHALGVIEQARNGLDATRVRDMVKHLDTPPTDPGAFVCQSFDHGFKRSWRELSPFEVGCRNSTIEAAESVDFLAPLAELLDQQLLRRHFDNDTWSPPQNKGSQFNLNLLVSHQAAGPRWSRSERRDPVGP